MELLEREDVRVVRGLAAKGDVLTLAALAAGGVTLLFVGWKVAKIAMRVSGPVSSALTIAGLLLWIREQLFAEYEEEDEEPV